MPLENLAKQCLSVFSLGYLLGLVALLQAGQTLADTIVGRVVGAHDGDTITVLDGMNTQHKVRLAGIDAPETSLQRAEYEAAEGVARVRKVGLWGDVMSATLGVAASVTLSGRWWGSTQTCAISCTACLTPCLARSDWTNHTPQDCQEIRRI